MGIMGDSETVSLLAEHMNEISKYDLYISLHECGM